MMYYIKDDNGNRWKVREAVSLRAACSEIAMARVTGSVGSTSYINALHIGGTVQAQHLQPGDIVGSGEKVYCVSAGVRTPKGKIEVYLKNKNDIGPLDQIKHWDRMSLWGKYAMINVERER